MEAVVTGADCATSDKSATIAATVAQLAEKEQRARLAWLSVHAKLLMAVQEWMAGLSPDETQAARERFAKLLTDK